MPPFGQETNENLQSIFEVAHLRDSAIFLDTQCKLSVLLDLAVNFMHASTDRMPPQIGDFISTAVYGGQLQSNPSHPITDQTIACHLVNVGHGKQQSQDHSFKVCDYCMIHCIF